MEYCGLSNKKPGKKSVLLLISYLVVTIPFNKIIQTINVPPWPYWLHLAFNVIIYAIIALLIIEERENLENSHIDKYALIIFLVFGSILRSTTASNVGVVLISSVIFVLIAFFLINSLRGKEIHFSKTNKMGFWILLASIVGVWEIVVIVTFGFPIPNAPIFSSTSFLHLLSWFFYHLGNSAISEEPIFRGFLWGYLRSLGNSDRKIVIIQAILFAIGHFDISGESSVYSLISPFIFSLLIGFVALKTRSITPGLVSHAIRNTVVDLLR